MTILFSVDFVLVSSRTEALSDGSYPEITKTARYGRAMQPADGEEFDLCMHRHLMIFD